MKKYNLESLKNINQVYDYQHRITESDVQKANNWVELIEGNRNNKIPQVGDIVQFTNKHGDFYGHSHVESINGDQGKELSICEQPYIPFVGLSGNRFYTSTSGGAWSAIPNNLKLVGQEEKLFKDWGHCGACANGAFNFQAKVNVWEYIEPEQLFKGYSTKTHNKFYVSVLEDEKQREQHNNYKYLIQTNGATSHTAFRTDKEYQAWLKTYNGKEFAGYWQNQKVIWTDKQIEKRVSLEEYNSIDGIIDTMLENGSKWECKRVYKDNQVITYKTPYEDRKKLDYRNTVEYQAAYNSL